MAKIVGKYDENEAMCCRLPSYPEHSSRHRNEWIPGFEIMTLKNSHALHL